MNTDAVPDRNTSYSSSDVMAAPMAPRLFGRARERSRTALGLRSGRDGQDRFPAHRRPGRHRQVQRWWRTSERRCRTGRCSPPAAMRSRSTSPSVDYARLSAAPPGICWPRIARPWLSGASGSKIPFDRMAVLSAISCRSSNDSSAHRRRRGSWNRRSNALRLHEALGALLAALAGAGTPFVLFLDDLQWCGQPTLDLLPHLVLPRAGQALLVVGTVRTGEAGPDGPLEEVLDRISGSGS